MASSFHSHPLLCPCALANKECFRHGGLGGSLGTLKVSMRGHHILLVWFPLFHPKTFEVLFLLSPLLYVPVDVSPHFDWFQGKAAVGLRRHNFLMCMWPYQLPLSLHCGALSAQRWEAFVLGKQPQMRGARLRQSFQMMEWLLLKDTSR